VQENQIIHGDWMDNNISDKSIQLIIADPPYFRVKGGFDFVWDSFGDYLKDVERWAVECKRVLADNGTLFWWGIDRKIAYSQIIFDKYFELLSTLVWEKPSIANEWETRRTFIERGQERILVYANKGDKTGLEIIVDKYIKPNNPFSKYLREEFKKANITNKELAKLFPSKTGGLTGCVSNWLNGDNVITKEQYLKIRNYLNNEYLKQKYEDLRQEHEELRKKYENNRRYFNNCLNLKDIFRFSRVYNPQHPTQKPEDLTAAIINTCSRKNDLILIPFAGSGTECVCAHRYSRRFIAYEILEKYCLAANRRLKEAQMQTDLFRPEPEEKVTQQELEI